MRPQSNRTVHVAREGLEFNTTVEVEECEAVLSDGGKRVLLACVDQASSFCIAWPLESNYAVSGEEFLVALGKPWLAWAGPPKVLRYDSRGAHRAAILVRCVAQHGIIGDPQPGEDHRLIGQIERKHGLFKRVLAQTNHEFQLNVQGNPMLWISRVTAASNNLLRRSGHAPAQFVFGRSMRTPPACSTRMSRCSRRSPTQRFARWPGAPSWCARPPSRALTRSTALRASTRYSGDGRATLGLLIPCRLIEPDQQEVGGWLRLARAGAALHARGRAQCVFARDA